MGPYRYRDDGPFADDPDGRNTRDVEWLSPEVPYECFDADLRQAFGQRGTVSEIDEENAAARILEVLRGADASAIHLVLKWSPAIEGNTIEHHREVAEQAVRGARHGSGSLDRCRAFAVEVGGRDSVEFGLRGREPGRPPRPGTAVFGIRVSGTSVPRIVYGE